MNWQALKAYTTLPELLQYVLNAYSNSYAFNYREAGYWRHLSSEEFVASVRRFALGLVKLGLKKGDAVGILASPSPHWLVADLATMIAGGVSVPFFANISDQHLVYEATNCKLKYLVVVDEAQWQLAEPHLKLFSKVITKSVIAGNHHTIDFQGVMELGDAASQADPQQFARLRDAVVADDVATIIYTSGSTGEPKGVMLSHGNLVSQVHGACERFPLDPVKDKAMSCLPLAHVLERMVMYTYIAQGVGIYFCDDIKNVGAVLAEVKPTVITMVPRILEKFYARIEQQVDNAGAVKRLLGRWAMKLASNHEPESGRHWRLNFADSLVYKRLRGALGGQLKYLIVGGAPLADELARFLVNIKVPIYIGYGLTEASPVVAVNYPGNRKLGTVGRPYPGVEVRIAGNGEILARGASIMRGYHQAPEATAAVIDHDRWLHTGDLGRIDDEGYLVITGRLKELLKTSNGKYVCPVPIEQALSSAAPAGLVEQAMVVAEGRRFVAALLFANPEALRRNKERLGCAQLSDQDFLNHQALKAELASLVGQVNKGLDHWEQIREYRLLLTPPSVESDELTPTLKIRRHVVAEKYRALIDEMYLEKAQDKGQETGRKAVTP